MQIEYVIKLINTPTTVAREKEIKRIENIAKQTAETFQHLKNDEDLKNMINFSNIPEE